MATAFEMEGKVKVIKEAQTFASGFSKREFVVEVADGQYTQEIALECLKDKAAMLDELAEGDGVKVSFDIRGREYQGRHFVNLVAWKIEKQGGGSGGGGSADAGPAADGPPAGSNDAYFDNQPEDGDDDIPF